MVTLVYVPRWGITMEQATVVGWCAAVGDRVDKGQELVELETEKMLSVVEAPADGMLREILVQEGESAAVGELLAVFAEEDEIYDLASLRKEKNAEKEEVGGFRARAGVLPEKTAGGDVHISPAARRLAADYALDLDQLEATGPGGSLSRGDIERTIEQMVVATLESKYIEADGFKLHYLCAGGAKARLKKAGPTVVLLHGIGGSTSLWQANLTALAVRHPVVAVDLPGHGLSDKPSGDYSLEFFSDAISGILKELGPEPVVLVGHSLGGHIALQVARKNPGKVGRMVLVSAGGLGPDLHLSFLDGLLSGLNVDATRAMLQGLFHDPALVTRPMLESTYENLSKPGAWEALVATVSTYKATPYERVEGLTIPTLLVCGAQDAIVPPSYAKEAQARFANAELWVAEECGHCPQIEKVTEFNARICLFLEKPAV